MISSTVSLSGLKRNDMEGALAYARAALARGPLDPWEAEALTMLQSDRAGFAARLSALVAESRK